MIRRRAGRPAIWAETGAGVRFAALAMWSAAVAGTVLGVLGDRRGWWADMNFLTNLLSSLVGGLFGIPVALIVVSRIAAAESRRRQRAEAVRFARLSAVRLGAELAGLVPAPDLAAEADERLDRLVALLPGVPERRYGPELADALRLFTEACRLLPGAVLTGAAAGQVLRDADGSWRFLREHVAPRLREHGLHWIPAAADERMRSGFAVAATFARAGLRDAAELDAAARSALAAGSLEPLVELCGDDELVVDELRERAEGLRTGIRAVLDLRREADGLVGALMPAAQ